MSQIVLENVGYTYRRGGAALLDVTGVIDAGVVGLIGPNGAGKTTLMRLLAGVVAPTQGQIRIDGIPPDEYRKQGRAALVPDSLPHDGFLHGIEFLEIVAKLTGASVDDVPSLPDEIAHRRIDQLSLGQRRRVELAAARIGNPSLVLLDEPTIGLDPLAVRALRADIESMRAPDRTIVVSSHHIDELERMVDDVLLLRAGRLAGHYARDRIVTEWGSFDELVAATFAAESAS